MDSENIIEVILKVLDEKKAQDILAYNVKGLTSLFDYILICSTSNSVHVKSLKEDVLEVLHSSEKEVLNVESDENNTWIIIDCNDFVVNIFHNKTREFYNLEGLWADAPIFKLDCE